MRHQQRGLDAVDTFEIPYSCEYLYMKVRLSAVRKEGEKLQPYVRFMMRVSADLLS